MVYIHTYMYIYVLCILSLYVFVLRRGWSRENQNVLVSPPLFFFSFSQWFLSRVTRAPWAWANVQRFKHEKTLGKPMKNLSSYACHAAPFDHARHTTWVEYRARETGVPLIFFSRDRSISRLAIRHRSTVSLANVTCAICVSRIITTRKPRLTVPFLWVYTTFPPDLSSALKIIYSIILTVFRVPLL